jgi:putative membrane protein
MKTIKLTLIGFVLGITAVIPGFSVATMAVVFNVYERLINVIVPNVKIILTSWLFWLPLVLGGIAGIIFSSKVITVLFENFYIPVSWFFIGVISGSIPLIYLRINASNTNEQKRLMLPSIPSIICFILAFSFMILMAIIKKEGNTVIYNELTLHVFGLLFMAGSLGAIAMIIPGISGAFVLLVTGLYYTVLQIVSDLNILQPQTFLLLIPIVLGALTGLLLSTAFVRFLLLKVPEQTYSAVLGLVTGSILVIYPGSFTFQICCRFPCGSEEITGIIISVICLLSGFALSFLMSFRDVSRNR